MGDYISAYLSNLFNYVITGGGGFAYVGGEYQSRSVTAELLGIVSYDSQSGGQHGGLVEFAAGNYSFGYEAMRTWSNWQETISPIGFVNGSKAISPTQLDPLKMASANYGGLLEYENGQIQIGGYLGGAGGARAAGIGGYIGISVPQYP